MYNLITQAQKAAKLFQYGVFGKPHNKLSLISSFKSI